MLRYPGVCAAVILSGCLVIPAMVQAQDNPPASAESVAASTTTVDAQTLKESENMARSPDAPQPEEPAQPAQPASAAKGDVQPTAAGGKGGATTYTMNMPLDAASLIKMRQPYLNRPEFRGAWITRFEWIVKKSGKFDVEGTKQKILSMLDNAKAMNLNALFFQVRGDATTFYSSSLEPWSQRMDGKDPGFDFVKFAIDECHKRGIEFHAYFNAMPCTEERTTVPASADHIFRKHCMPDSVPNWLVYQDGHPAPPSEYRWLNPNLPEVQVYVRNAVMDLVTRYDVDGIHYDRIRFPGPKASDDPWSKERFKAGEANPYKLTYNQWEADNITRMLTDIYASILEVKPRIKTSASVWGIYDNTKLPQGRNKATGYSWTSSGLQNYMQDSIAWINKGCMDAIVPMIYWNMGGNKPDYDELLLTFKNDIKSGRHLYGGQAVFDGPEMVREVVAGNLVGAEGCVPFTLNKMSQPGLMQFYQQNINPTAVKVPDMPWKSAPKKGAVLVTVKGPGGKPMTDAHVTIQGLKDVGLSSADGFCSFIEVPPGQVTIKAVKPGAGIATATATVAAGKATRVNLSLKQDQTADQHR
jgi:uncharacterized lipoprotein YddW (UPF0748 family)